MKAKRNPSAVRCRLLLWMLCVFACACCPSGIWEDNFGNRYLITTRINPEGTRVTEGNVDTLGSGCGIWSIEQDEPDDARHEVAFVARNPRFTPYDNCCRAFRFEGNQTSPGCILITGRFEARDEKCDQSGPMSLEALR